MNIHGLNSGSNYASESFLKSLPPVTRAFLILTVSMTLLVKCKIIPLYSILFNGKVILYQPHRLLTSILYAGSFINLIFVIMMWVNVSASLERQRRLQTASAYAALVFTLIIMISLSSIALRFPYGYPSLLTQFRSALLYLSTIIRPEDYVSFYGYKMKNKYLPLAYLVIDLMFGTDIVQSLQGYVMALVFDRFEKTNVYEQCSKNMFTNSVTYLCDKFGLYVSGLIDRLTNYVEKAIIQRFGSKTTYENFQETRTFTMPKNQHFTGRSRKISE